jgi:adenylate cyclase
VTVGRVLKRRRDTVRADVDWDAEGLLDELPDEQARQARRELLDELHADGVSLEELKQAAKEQRLALLPVERLLGSDQRYSQEDIAEQCGIDVEYLQATRRALGLPVPPPDAKVLGEKELEAARIGARLREAGFDDEGMLESTRVLGRGMARYAEAIRTLGASSLLAGGADEHELGRRFAAATEALLPLAGPWLEYVFSLHLRQVLRTDAVTFEEMTTGHLSESRDQAIGFADLVGFTELGETAGVEELTSVAAQLSRLAGEVVEPPVRVVKVIGDAVMLVSPEPEPMVATMLDLVERAEEAESLPQLRGGVAYGPAVNRWGDWFGSTVNVASRLTARARPGSVLATEELRDAAKDGFNWSSAGPKRLKGISEPVKTYRVRRAPDASAP